MSRQAKEDRRYPRPLPDVRRAAQLALSGLAWHWKPTQDGGFDATCVSRFLKYRDDVSIRFHSAGGTLVRIQSVSRSGLIDFGQNSKHIRDFFDQLDNQLAQTVR
jgi:hypothetical protein